MLFLRYLGGNAMKKFFKYLLFCVPLLFGISNVNASSIVDYSKLSFTQSAEFLNCKSNNNCSFVDTKHETSSSGSKTIDIWGSVSQLNSISNSSGIGLAFYSESGFIKDNIYTVTILVDVPNATTYTTNSNKVGIGKSLANAYGNATGYIEGYDSNNISVDFYGDSVISNYFSYLSYTFKASDTGNFIFLTMSTKSTANNYWKLYGYSVMEHGSQAPSADDIKNALNSSFTDINSNINNVQDNINSSIDSAQSSINNNINSVNDNIDNVNSNINEMKDNIDNTLNSEDDDVTSSKCGIVCKLKGVVTGITNLPSLIWEKLRAGFDAISGAITALFDSIKGIFLPEPDCTSPTNLFDFDKYVSDVTSSKGSKVTGTADNFTVSANTSSNAYYYINLGSGTYTFSFDYETTSNDFSVSYVGNSCNPSAGRIIRSWVDGLSGHVEYTTTCGDIQSIEFKAWNSSATIKNLKIVEGTQLEEVCTETSFFGWFERFGQIIKGFFDTLLGGILEGLKGLFVPTDEQLMDIIDKSKELSENFGFVGQSINFFLNIFTSLLGMVNANGCVELPEMTIGATTLFESHTFWNEQLVCLNDNKILADNIDTIRTITSVALVCMFVNFASKKFFNILSKNDNDQAKVDSYDIR